MVREREYLGASGRAEATLRDESEVVYLADAAELRHEVHARSLSLASLYGDEIWTVVPVVEARPYGPLPGNVLIRETVTLVRKEPSPLVMRTGCRTSVGTIPFPWE